jgi:pimeloyl-ACP methyl ester carboxylesterase
MRDLLITLVHGTFAPDARWTAPGSALREHLLRGLSPYYVDFKRWSWSGANRHNARCAAAEAFSKYIEEVRRDYPRHAHIVIAHSHGGNVVLQAVTASAATVDGVVCLATPFISTRANTALAGWFREHAELLSTLVLLAGAASSWAVGAFVYDIGQKVGANDLFTALATFVTAVGLFAFVFRAADRWFNGLQLRASREAPIAQSEAERLARPPSPQPPLLVVRAPLDEALWPLRIVDVATVDLRKAMRVLNTAATVLGGSLFLISMPLGLVLMSGRIADGVGGCGVVLLLLALLSTAVTEFAMWPLIAALRAMAFGESKWSSFVFSMSTSPRPLNGWRYEERIISVAPPAFPYLAHCAIYDEPAALTAVSDWVQECIRSSAG